MFKNKKGVIQWIFLLAVLIILIGGILIFNKSDFTIIQIAGGYDLKTCQDNILKSISDNQAIQDKNVGSHYFYRNCYCTSNFVGYCEQSAINDVNKPVLK